MLRSSSPALPPAEAVELALLRCGQRGTPGAEAGVRLQTLCSVREAWEEGRERCPCPRELPLRKANVVRRYTVQALGIQRILPPLTGKRVARVARFREE